MLTLVASVLYNFHAWSALVLNVALYFEVGCRSVDSWATVSSRNNTGKVPVVKLMYAVAVFPGLAIAQMAGVVWREPGLGHCRSLRFPGLAWQGTPAIAMLYTNAVT